MSSVNTEKTRRMVGLSILTALVIVLQFVAEYIKVGATPITLTLVPIVVGSALYGVRGGAWLGGVFGVVVWLMSIANIDPTGALLWNLNPFLTTVICIGKALWPVWPPPPHTGSSPGRAASAECLPRPSSAPS